MEDRQIATGAKEVCPLCSLGNCGVFDQDAHRVYHRCSRCALVFAARRFWLCPDEEKQRYDCHQNSLEDEGYVRFLRALFEPVNSRLKPGSFGLDYGSGPGPTLNKLFEAAGHTVNIYDPFYSTDTTVLQQSYDFITLSEVAEHMYAPGDEFNRIWKMLAPGGMLAVMTSFAPQVDFADWHYRNDDTHVVFYTKETFLYMSKLWNCDVFFEGKNVTVFTRTSMDKEEG